MSTAEAVLSNCCSFFQPFGLIYFSIKNLSQKTAHEYPTIYYTIYFVIIFVTLTTQAGFLAYFILIDDPEKFNAKNALNYIVQHSVWHGLILILYVAFIQSYSATPKLKKTFIKFMEISNSFRRDFQHNVDYKCLQKWMIRLISKLYLFHFIMQAALIMYDRYCGNSYALLRSFLATVLISILGMTVLKFVFFVNTMF